MRKVILIITVLIFTSLSNSQGWVQQQSGVTASFSSVFFIDVNTGYTVGYGGGTILKTTNGGTNWINISIGGSGFNSVYFIQNTGYIVGNSGIIYKTINSGLSWVSQTSGTPFNLYSVFFADANTGYITGHDLDPPNSVIRKTTNGGTTWLPVIFPPSSYGLRSLYFFNSNTGFAGGRFGVIIKTTNGGISWSSQNLLPNQTMILSIYFADLNTGYLTGGEPFTGGLIFKTTNAGLNWVNQLSGLTNTYLHSIHVPPQTGNNTAYITGQNGRILQTTNGGLSWNIQVSGITTLLSSVRFTSSATGYAVGDNGRILKTTTGGITAIQPVSSEIPSGFSLSQNYPNPFNPTTNIEFSIPKSGFVSLVIYDATGREIETLVNGELKPGTYKADWDASKYSSGVYFYKLFSNEFTETRKMALIR